MCGPRILDGVGLVNVGGFVQPSLYDLCSSDLFGRRAAELQMPPVSTLDVTETGASSGSVRRSCATALQPLRCLRSIILPVFDSFSTHDLRQSLDNYLGMISVARASHIEILYEKRA